MKKKVAIITCFFSLFSIAIAGYTDPLEENTKVINGNILYVGGFGPNNYTRIQDAIDDSSPYYENLLFKFIRNLENISSDLKKALLQIINTVINTSKICNEACSGIDKEKYLANREMCSHRNKNKEIIKKMDIQQIRKACAMILYTLKKEIPILEKNSMHYKFPTFKYPPFIAIGGRGNDSYYHDYYIIIDFGGDDKYYNNAGSTVIYYNGEIIGGVSICIDLEGNDYYESGYFNSQGSGVFGIGILYDAKGNDVYISEDCSQGEGEMGIGILIDKKGNDFYFAGPGSQGFGWNKGIGILIDMEGEDIYKTTPLGFSQGSSTEWGIGILMDLKGNDSYASYSLSQAAADYFGFSALIDFSGNDVYEAESFSQAYARFMSSSFLLDFEGDDIFVGGEQGNAIFGFALLVNLLGSDKYSGKGKDNAIWLNGFIGLGIDIGK